jgi:outer membrane protein
MISKWNKYHFLVCIGLVFIGESGKTQVPDTLHFSDIVRNVIQNNPLIKESGEKVNSSELAVQLARTAYMPTLDINADYSHMAPIPSFDIEPFGHIQLYPDNSMNYSISAHQLLYDFGRTSRSAEVSEKGKELATLSAEQLKQKLVLQSAGLFYSLVYFQVKKEITNEHLNTLKKHMKVIEEKQITGSATQYEILSTQVEVSSSETELSEIDNNYIVILSQLNSLMGSHLDNIVFDYDTNSVGMLDQLDSSYVFAASHRDELLIGQNKQSLEELNYRMLKASNNPTLGIFASGGYKNGYLPEIEKLEANYIVGISLNFPVFDGNRKHIKLQMADCSIKQSNYDLENISHYVHDQISESYSQLLLAEKKIEQSKIQLQLAQEAYAQAELKYNEGVITNLDLIYAEDALASSKLMLLKNKVDNQLYMLKFKAAIGERLY